MTDGEIKVGETGWFKDPFERHEDRYFSVGQPTRLVRDAGVESSDPPPAQADPIEGPLERNSAGDAWPSDHGRPDGTNRDPEHPDYAQHVLDVFPQIAPGWPTFRGNGRPRAGSVFVFVAALAIFVGSLFVLHALDSPRSTSFTPSAAPRNARAATVRGPTMCGGGGFTVNGVRYGAHDPVATVTSYDTDQRLTVHPGDDVAIVSPNGQAGPVLSGERSTCVSYVLVGGQYGSEHGDVVTAMRPGILTVYYFPISGGPPHSVVEVSVVSPRSPVPGILFLIVSALLAIGLPLAILLVVRRRRRASPVR